MDLHSVLLQGIIAACSCVVSVPLASAGDGNAVGGTVRSEGTGEDLGYVKVCVAEETSLNDLSSDEDGAYVLKIPIRLGRFDLVYEKNGYLDNQILDRSNDRDQQKIEPPVEMQPIQAISSLSEEDALSIVGSSIDATKKGMDKEYISLILSGIHNLKFIRDHINPEFDEISNTIQMALGEFSRQMALEEFSRSLLDRDDPRCP